jgi:iron complex transport system substrate-binding protein
MNVDPEWLLQENPDMIRAAGGNYYCPGVIGFEIDDTKVVEKAKMDIVNSPIFQNSMAVDNEDVFLFDSHFTVNPRLVVLMAYWAKWMHPELFKDFDPRAVHQEYLDRFYRIDYDLETSGVFFYPEP